MFPVALFSASRHHPQQPNQKQAIYTAAIDTLSLFFFPAPTTAATFLQLFSPAVQCQHDKQWWWCRLSACLQVNSSTVHSRCVLYSHRKKRRRSTTCSVSLPACLHKQGEPEFHRQTLDICCLFFSFLALPMTSARTHVDLLLKAHTGTQAQTQACSQFE